MMKVHNMTPHLMLECEHRANQEQGHSLLAYNEHSNWHQTPLIASWLQHTFWREGGGVRYPDMFLKVVEKVSMTSCLDETICQKFTSNSISRG